MEELCTHSATRLARMIREGEVSSREAVEAHIARIERVNPALNAVVQSRFDEARAEADAADALVRDRSQSSGSEPLPPFLGVPFTAKEALALAGMPYTSGLVARAGILADEDGAAIARTRAAGAIPLGVTNVSELCMWMECNNLVYGRTNNPYNPGHTAGGSSGGEGSIVGAGASPFGVGADIGGSIRIPAFFNGVFGHKPTGGLIPTTGHFPMADNEARRYLTVGPIARRAEDLWPLVKLMAGPDGTDSACTAWRLGDPAKVDVAQMTVFVADRPASDEMTASLHAAADALAARGARVEPLEHQQLRHAFDIWSSMLSAAGGVPFGTHLGNGVPSRPVRELPRWALGRSPHTLPALMLALFELFPRLAASRAQRFVDMGYALKRELMLRIGPNNVMLHPAFPYTAPAHHKLLIRFFDCGYTGLFNVLQFPSTQVPAGLDASGMPLGVQLVGIPGSDHLTIALAELLEEDLGGWVFPHKL